MKRRTFWTSGKDKLNKRIEQLENELKRVNTLEVNVKRFLKIEGDLSTLLYKNNVGKGAEKAFFKKNDIKDEQLLLKKVNEKLIALERKLHETQTQLHKEQLQNKQLIKRLDQLNERMEKQALLDKQPVVFQEINVDHMMIDKYELYNNIAQLGVKDLSGSLNIGPTYGKGILPDELTEDLKEKMDEMKDKMNQKEVEDDSSDNSENK